MTRPCLVALLALASACAPDDADYDGFGADVDCDDADPYVYPGAPDTPGDGLDTDCADGDPTPGYLGNWELQEITASYSGIQLFVEGTASGLLTVSADETATAEITATVNPDVVGSAIAITVNVAGEISRLDGPDTFLLYAEGENYDELMHVNWDCAAEGDELLCLGELKALDASLDGEAHYLRVQGVE